MRVVTASMFAAALAAATPAVADTGTIAVLSYNVRGLPKEVIEDRTAQIAAIAPKLEDIHTAGGGFDGRNSLVLLQELFDAGYYSTLTDPMTVSYPFVTSKDTGGPSMIGDGLNMLSDFSFAGFARTQWMDCFGSFGSNGSDCDTNKGYSFAEITVASGAVVHVYNLHADAGQDEGSRTARRKNIQQLTAAINANSPAGTAVIVMGDTNSRYTRTPNDNIETLLSGADLDDVWVELVRGSLPGMGSDIESGCVMDPGGANCELIDKILYRSGSDVTLTPTTYDALQDFFSDAMGNDLSDHIPVYALFDFETLGTTTSSTSSTSVTTSSSTSTTTTTVPPRDCGDPINPIGLTAADALYTLRAAVGSVTCALCLCDINGNGTVQAVDALTVLKKVVGQNVTFSCPAC